MNDAGLSSSEVAEAYKKFGPNILSSEAKSGLLKTFFLQFNNPMVYILLTATTLSIFMGERLNAFAILIIVLINSIIGFIQEQKAESSMMALKQLSVPKARVRRDNKIEMIDSSQIVPGDLLVLEAGDYIVADAIVAQASQLSSNEAILTGESIPTEKKPGDLVHAGTALNSGSGLARVATIGMQTELGKIAALLNKTKRSETPLQKKMNEVSYKLFMLAGAVMVFVFILGYLKHRPLISVLMYAISLAVAAIPEGLPTVVTLALILAARRMIKKNAIIRKMAAVETLGSADVICTDKTGTLTTGKMVVREKFTLEDGICEGFLKNSQEFYLASVLCNNASVDNQGSGDATEVALLIMSQDEGQDVKAIYSKAKRLKEWNFDSDRKRMSVLIDNGKQKILYCKGAPESVVPLCKLNKSQTEKIENALRELTDKGRRVLALSSKLINQDSDEEEKDLDFLGLVSIADPPKKETFGAIKACHDAGIRVIMITGDHPRTAEAIAKELGIIIAGKFEGVLTGRDLDEMNPETLLAKSEKIAVYARATSEHKLQIVQALQKNGHVVGMTGDGVNDAPALQQASIGIAMGKAGTEVARQAADMVLTDDNFSTIVSAVEEGRAVHGNIKRTLQYLLSTNTSELLIFFGTILFGMPNPFIPLGILWINIVTDGFPSLALSTEPVGKDLLAKSSGPSSRNFFDNKFLKELFVTAIMMTTIELIVYAYALSYGSGPFAKTCAFNLLIYLTLLRSFSCRSDTEIYFRLKFNPYHLASVLFPIGLQILLQYNDLFLKLFQITQLSLLNHLILIVIGLIPVSVVELVKAYAKGKKSI